eukprot:388403_1
MIKIIFQTIASFKMNVDHMIDTHTRTASFKMNVDHVIDTHTTTTIIAMKVDHMTVTAKKPRRFHVGNNKNTHKIYQQTIETKAFRDKPMKPWRCNNGNDCPHGNDCIYA